MIERVARDIARQAQTEGHCGLCGNRTRNAKGKIEHTRDCKLVREHTRLNLAVVTAPNAEDVPDDNREYPVPTIGESIETLRKIVATCSMHRLPGGLQCDLFTASAIVGVYDALGEEARAKFSAMGLLKGQAVAFKLIEKAKS